MIFGTKFKLKNDNLEIANNVRYISNDNFISSKIYDYLMKRTFFLLLLGRVKSA